MAVSFSNVQAKEVDASRIDISDTATGHIHDDDGAKVTIEDVSINEADGSMSFTATLDHAVQGGFEVDVNIGGTVQTLQFTGAANEQHSITYNLPDDTTVEADGSVAVSLSNVQARDVDASRIDISDRATGHIHDDDGAKSR